MLPENSSGFLTDVVTIGAVILEHIKEEQTTLDDLLKELPQELGLSIDHIILSMDWLYSIKAIEVNKEEILIIKNANRT